MRLRLGALNERLRSSLFFVPMTSVLAALVLGLLGLAVDSRIGPGGANLPLGLTSTVQSARTLRSTIASATITFAGIAFSISLLIIQLASSQYSPRIVHTLFRDPFNKRVMALVVGTFTYCLIVLRSVRSALDQSGTPVIPNLSVAVAVVLGIATILAVVAFINHSAQAMDISEILERVRRESVDHARHEWSLAEPGPRPTDPVEAPVPPDCVIRFDRSGWVQHFDADALLRQVPESGIIRLETHEDRYAIAGVPLCSISPAPADVEETTRKSWSPSPSATPGPCSTTPRTGSASSPTSPSRRSRPASTTRRRRRTRSSIPPRCWPSSSDATHLRCCARGTTGGG